MDDPQLRELLDFFGLSWKGYRRVRKGVKKRITRFMSQKELPGMPELLSALGADDSMQRQVENLLNISISRFFRDRGLWQTLENSLLPAILARPTQEIKVWSGGCARGEEAYSVKILWERVTKNILHPPRLEVWASDMNPVFLNKAQAGIYSQSSLKEVPAEICKAYFYPVQGDDWAISASIKEGIFWKVHHLLSDPPPWTGFEIIFLRNTLLTYYIQERQVPALGRVISALNRGGFLIIGSHEKLPRDFRGLEPAFHPSCIFQKVDRLEGKYEF